MYKRSGLNFSLQEVKQEEVKQEEVMDSSSGSSSSNVHSSTSLPSQWNAAANILSIVFSIVGITLIERVLHALLCTLWHLVIGFQETENTDDAKYTIAAIQLVSTSVSIFNRILFAIINVFLQCFSSIVSWTLFFVMLFGVTGLVFIAYEQYPTLARGFGQQWNTYVGPQVHAVVMVPLQLGLQLLRIVLPIYNTFVWIITGITTSSILPPLLKAPQRILQCITALTWAAKTTVDSLTAYSQGTFQTCAYTNSSAFSNITAGSGSGSGIGSISSCVADVGSRTLDLITPMSHVRQVFAVLIAWVAKDVCTPAGAVVDVLLYPLTDINFAKSVHNIFNAILWTVLQVPVVTANRCQLFKDTDGVIMCIPDFEPGIQFLKEGLRKFGQTIDNWLDIFLMVLEHAFYPSSAATCDASPLSSLRTDQDNTIQKLLFGNNFTTVVGLTETLFAMTDGVSIIYYSTDKLALQSEISQDAWPFPVDPRIGIAAVKYSSTDVASTSMMGCRCDDLDTAAAETYLSITCAIVEYGVLTASSDVPDPSGLLNNHSMPVVFQVDTTRNYMKCGQTKISLESIRWPRRRFVSVSNARLPLLSTLQGSQSSQAIDESQTVDAALWVQPFCGADDKPSQVCLETFTKAACFPYCMAIRQSGSYNSMLRLYNAPDWLNRVHLFNRDCLPSSEEGGFSSKINGINSLAMNPQSLFLQPSSSSGSLTSVSPNDIIRILSNDWTGASTHGTQEGSTATAQFSCVHNPLVTSIVPKETLFKTGAGDYGDQFFGSTLASGQPFVYAGDTVLTAECESLDPNDALQIPNCIVKVHRIYASEENQYTLVETNARLPAKGVASTPQGAQFMYPSNVLRIPYSYTTNPWTHNPATVTENAVFYAVNPYWQVFSAFIQYCNNPNQEGSLQLSVTSSFAQISVYRIYAYTYCPPFTQNPSGCYEDLYAGVRIPTSRRPEFDVNDCYEPMDIAVSSLEYINTENIAINVVRARLADTNPDTLIPTNSSTMTYFLNTITMQVRKDKAWQTEVEQPIVTQGVLCPALRRMPQFGTLFTELGVAGLLFLRMPLNILLNGVYIFERWGSSTDINCPIVTRGHSAVLNACGPNALSLKAFFASMSKVNDVFFNTIAIVAKALTGLPGSGNVRIFLNGIKMFGRYQYDPMIMAVTGGRWANVALGATPLQGSALNALTTTLQLPSYIMAFKLGVANMAMADFIWHFAVDMIYRIVRASKKKTGATSADGVFFITMYDFKKNLDEIVTKNMMQSCAGLSLMFGYTNPWAQFARFQCNAASTILGNIVDFLTVFLVRSLLMLCFPNLLHQTNFLKGKFQTFLFILLT